MEDDQRRQRREITTTKKSNIAEVEFREKMMVAGLRWCSRGELCVQSRFGVFGW